MDALLSQFPQLALVAGVLILGFLFYRHWRAGTLNEAMHKYGRMAALTVDRLVDLTPTEKDNRARDFVKARLKAMGYAVDGSLEEEIKAIVKGEYKAYLVDDLGIPAHVDGAAGKALVAKLMDRAANPPALISSEDELYGKAGVAPGK